MRKGLIMKMISERIARSSSVFIALVAASLLAATFLVLPGCSGTNENTSEQAAEEQTVRAESEAEETEASEFASSEGPEQQEEGSSGLSADFKAMMDGYEDFADEYVAFMQEYSTDSPTAEAYARYGEMMSKYSEVMSRMQEIDYESLSPEEYGYAAEVQARINEKIAKLN